MRARIAQHGLRNSLLVAIAPTATIASIAGCYECIEPQVSNLFKRETLSGEFLQINAALVGELKDAGLWTAQIRDAIKRADGSVQGITELPDEVTEVFRTAWELPQRALIDLAAARAPFIDQSSRSTSSWPSPTIGKLSSMYLYAWKSGLKTTYYLRSRPATPDPAGDRPTAAPAIDAASARLLPGEPRDLRGVPVTAATGTDGHEAAGATDAARPGDGPDPAADALPALLSTGSATRSRTPGPSRRWTCTPTSPTSTGSRRPNGT